MQRWIILLRGVNVGGKHILPMKEWRAQLEALGCADVATYIQSGNAVLRSNVGSAADLQDLISTTIETHCGFRPRVFAMNAERLHRSISACPFAAEAEAEPKSVHYWFLAEPAASADLGVLEALQKPSERMRLTDETFYLHAPDGLGRSMLADKVERALGVAATARNANSVDKIAAMAFN